jgi:hypothetical protein
MVVRGWRVVRVGKEQEDITRLKGQALRDRMTSMVGATEPPGEVVRQWNNEAAQTSVPRDKMPGYFTGRSLSLEALTLRDTFEEELKAVENPDIGPLNKEIVRKSTPVDQLDSAPADSAIVILKTLGPAPFRYMGVSIRREGPAPYRKASIDGRPELFYAGPQVRGRKGNEQTLAFVVPPGRWHIFSHGGLIIYCLGAPFFDLKAGDVIYAGFFDLTSASLIPNISLEPAREFLAPAPGALSHLQSANWTNGPTRACGEGGLTGYALEYPDMPYAAGYRKAGSASASDTGAEKD